MPTWLPLVPLLLIAGTCVWVHRDATRLARESSPVVLRSQFVTLDSPQDWTIACVVGWVVFFPLYLFGRRQEA
jgi:hypothetical protein